eukprot:gene6131-12416_t
MSARHRAILLKQRNNESNKINTDDLNEDSDPECTPLSKFSVLELENDSDTSSVSEDPSENDEVAENSIVAIEEHCLKHRECKKTFVKQASKSGRNQRSDENENDDMNFLCENIDPTNAKNNSQLELEDQFESQLQELFAIDSSWLDIDNVLRRRFGGLAMNPRNEGDIPIKNNGSRNRNRTPRTLRKFIFGQPKEEWSRPPSYIGGGIGMDRYIPSTVVTDKEHINHGCPMWFRFNWSEEYKRLHEQYIDIQNSNDVNILLLFLSRNPHQAEGLLQLSMIFARTGHMDRAMDLIRRTLYFLECSMLESFKASRTNRRLDSSLLENNPFFIALFRYMQMSLMLGCPVVAANIACFLFSLDPVNDPMCTLLALDHMFLQAELYDKIQNIYNSRFILNNTSITSSITSTSSSFSAKEQREGHSQSPVFSSVHMNNKEVKYSPKVEVEVTIQDIPGCVASASLSLRSALIAWPFMLLPLVEAAVAMKETVSASSSLLSDDPDRGAGNNNDNVFLHLADIYASRNSSLWRKGGTLLWLQEVSSQLVKDIDAMSVTDYELMQQRLWSRLTSLSSSDVLTRYKNALMEDFSEEYPRLPPEANPLDPRLMDPRLLAPGGQDIAARMNIPGMGVDMVHQGALRHVIEAVNHGTMEGPVLIEEIRRVLGVNARQAEQVLADLRLHRRRTLGQAENERRSGFLINRLDPNLPLLQLFWQTLLPWNEIDTSGSTRGVRRDW